MSGRGPHGAAHARALAGIEETPHLSNRAIGKRVGVSMQTVMRARTPQTTKGKEMSQTKLVKLAEREPAVVESVRKALQNVIDFAKTRGKMLRSLTSERSEK